ncbi:Chondroitin synthase [Microbacterium azadirachtae]|uniref:Chondroitin synthase n=1 Tax=Microbacterium azadirachtae TaxID=582680 RepID=A0A0F0L1W5_9MICO|nr:glycosyltransferase [Microbacterium azadirachtae]KJL26355.1 Chondroitin synthase [Microbacterium azadirachtae]
MAEGRAGEATIGIVIPLYNGARHIADTLRSVLAQTHSALEVIVLDDGSSDDGAEIVRSMLGDPRLTLVQKRNEGIARTRNAGLALLAAGTKHVIFLDHDDLIAPDLCARLCDVLDRRPDAVGAFAIADWIDADSAPLGDGEFARFMRQREIVRDGRVVPVAPGEDATLPELFLANHLYPPSGILLRRGAIDAIGGFDPSYRVADDWDALVRLSRLGPIAALDEILVGYRRHGANASGDTALNVRESRAVWARTYSSADNSPADRRALQAAWRGMQRHKFRVKSEAARRALRSGRLLAACRLQLDALAHLALIRPLRRWGR